MIQFPAAPVIGQIFAPLPGVSYKFDGIGWGTNLSGTPTGDITVVGNIQVSGQGLFGDGTQGSPSIAFATEPWMGFYKVGGNTTAFTFVDHSITTWRPTYFTVDIECRLSNHLFFNDPNGTIFFPGASGAQKGAMHGSNIDWLYIGDGWPYTIIAPSGGGNFIFGGGNLEIRAAHVMMPNGYSLSWRNPANSANWETMQGGGDSALHIGRVGWASTLIYGNGAVRGTADGSGFTVNGSLYANGINCAAGRMDINHIVVANGNVSGAIYFNQANGQPLGSLQADGSNNFNVGNAVWAATIIKGGSNTITVSNSGCSASTYLVSPTLDCTQFYALNAQIWGTLTVNGASNLQGVNLTNKNGTGWDRATTYKPSTGIVSAWSAASSEGAYTYSWYSDGNNNWYVLNGTNMGWVPLNSDIRRKQDIVFLEADTEAFMRIRPISFRWRNIGAFKTGDVIDGFSAQNVRECFPQSTFGDFDAPIDKMDGQPEFPGCVNDRGVIARMVLEVQKLIHRMDQLEAQPK